MSKTRSPKIAILINNIGSPSSSSRRDVAKYLTQFLMDPEVIKLPWLWRTLLVRGLIVPFRSRSSAKKYRAVWTPQGAPLIVNSQNFARKLQRLLGPEFQVELAMNFGEPSIQTAVTKVANAEQILFCPMFPQYDTATSGASAEAFRQELLGQGISAKSQILDAFYFEPFFLKSFAQQVHITGPNDHVLFSFHGLPEKYLACNTACGAMENCLKCYKAHCHRTASFIARLANLTSEQWSVSFQSRLGPTKWLGPYTDQEVTRLARARKNIILASPAFVADCLETLEELGIEVRGLFAREFPEGHLHLLSCPNDEDGWVKGFAQHIIEKLNLSTELQKSEILELI
jgi:ferrochelatase